MDEQDLTASVDAAWAGFRGRLADRLAAMAEGGAEDEVLAVDALTGLADLDGAEPYVQFWVDDEHLHAEAVSNRYLDDRLRLDEAAESRLGAEWCFPNEAVLNFHLDVEPREVDRVAACAVRALRDVYGVLHPAFLSADGLEDAPGGPGGPGGSVVTERSAVERTATEDGLPQSHEELVAMVDAALAPMCDDGVVEHDPDGDVPFRVGMSVVFVRVLEERPAVELFAEVVVDPSQPERLRVELDILNREQTLAKFYLSGTTVRMSHEIVAWPFSGRQLRTVLARLLAVIDGVAESLALRVGGQRFLEMPEPEHQAPAEPAASHPGMSALLELLHLGPVSSPVVAELFDHDRRVITTHCTGIRSGLIDVEEHDEERVLTCLRRGLRLVVSGEVPERRPRPHLRRPVSEQASLIGDDEAGEDTLDLGWAG